MKFTPLKIKGAYLLELQPFRDERGSFARQFCLNELKAAGIDFTIKQCNVSHNVHAGTLRGMHYQRHPFPEAKIVSCIKGRIYDVMVDLRKGSPTFLQWQAYELSEDNGCMLYLPPYVAHGFQTLEDDSTVYYQLDAFFMPDYYAGVRWNDPKLEIEWPQCPNRIVNERDAGYELL